MEAAVLIGLLGAGYMYNSKEEGKNPINTTVNKEINMPSGENVYDSNHYEKSEKVIQSLAATNFEESHNENTKLINSQNLYKPVNNNNNYGGSILQRANSRGVESPNADTSILSRDHKTQIRGRQGEGHSVELI